MVNNDKKIAVTLTNVDVAQARKITRAITALLETATGDDYTAITVDGQKMIGTGSKIRTGYKVHVDGFKMTGVGANIRTKTIEVS